jgi:hypothetical protein
MKRVLFFALCACRSGPETQAGRFAAPLVAEAPATDEVVATVDGRPIRASQVALQARAAGTSAKQALDDLVDAELLVSEARRRRVDQSQDVEDAARTATVRRLLQTVFEAEVTPRAIPQLLVKRLYDDNKSLLDHDVKIDVWHILVPTDKKMPPAEQAAARTAAEELARRARSVRDADAFVALAPTVKAPMPAKAERVVTEKNGWTVHEFSYPAFEQLHQPGDTTSVIETGFGYHVMFLNRFQPAEHVPFSEAEATLRGKLFPEFQRREFVHFAERIAGSHEIVVHPERLK